MRESVLLGGGSFWGLDAALSALAGVLEVCPGYAGGSVSNPTKQLVDSGVSGHVEVVRVVYNPDVICFRLLLKAFFVLHDPTIANSGELGLPGLQHASVIFCYTTQQREMALEKIDQISKQYKSKGAVQTQVRPAPKFWDAEPENTGYYLFNADRDPYCSTVLRPILRKFARQFWPHLCLPESIRDRNPFE